MRNSKTMSAVLAVAAGLSIIGSAAPVFATEATGNFRSFGGKGSQTCLDVQFAGTNAGTRLDSTYCNGTVAQNFTLNNFWSGANHSSYEIVSNTNDSLCVEGNSSTGVVELEPCNASTAQQWVYYNGAIFWVANESYCLDVLQAKQGSDVTVDLTGCNGTVAQVWWPTGFGGVAIQSQLTPPPGNPVLCLDSSSASPIEIQNCNYGATQDWYLGGNISVGGNEIGELAATAPNGSGFGTLFEYGGPWTLEESWYMEFQGNGVSFVNNGNSECLDVAFSGNWPGNTVDTYYCNGTPAQIWTVTLGL